MAFALLFTTAAIADGGPAARRWPVIAWPSQITPIAIGNDLSINGLPLQIRAFVSAAPPDEVARWFRRSLGQPLLESRFGHQRVLGRQQGSHYLTVQLEPAGSGTRGLLGLTDLRAEGRAQPGIRHEAERARWPAGSRLYSQVVSQDAGRISRHTVIVNGHDEALNVARVKAVLAADGYAFEREARPAGDAAMPEGLATSRVLFFKGPGGEAFATVHRAAHGATAMVVNTIGRPEPSP